MEALSATKIMFVIFSGIIILFSILTVTSRRILRAAVYLLFVLISTAGIYFMLNYQFLAAVQITLYAGGIVVLIIFSILLTSHIDHKFEKISWLKIFSGLIASIAGIVICVATILQTDFVKSELPAANIDMKLIGGKLLSYGENGYILPFEVISILLLAAMIGAIVIAKRKSKA